MLRFIQEVNFSRKLALIEFGNGKDRDGRELEKNDKIYQEASCC